MNMAVLFLMLVVWTGAAAGAAGANAVAGQRPLSPSSLSSSSSSFPPAAASAADVVALATSTQFVKEGMAGAAEPNPYSFADLFGLTVGAEFGLVSGTAVSMVGGRSGLTQATPPVNHMAPALFGGANVRGLALGPASPTDAPMIGLPQAGNPASWNYAARFTAQPQPGFEFEKAIIPLDRMPEPAGWLIAASAILVGVFIARRRSAGHGA
jgi:hypothetical protein